jgi:hypothetical protein
LPYQHGVEKAFSNGVCHSLAEGRMRTTNSRLACFGETNATVDWQAKSKNRAPSLLALNFQRTTVRLGDGLGDC